jgi:hypothetical protein
MQFNIRWQDEDDDEAEIEAMIEANKEANARVVDAQAHSPATPNLPEPKKI